MWGNAKGIARRRMRRRAVAQTQYSGCTGMKVMPWMVRGYRQSAFCLSSPSFCGWSRASCRGHLADSACRVRSQRRRPACMIVVPSRMQGRHALARRGTVRLAAVLTSRFRKIVGICGSYKMPQQGEGELGSADHAIRASRDAAPRAGAMAGRTLKPALAKHVFISASGARSRPNR